MLNINNVYRYGTNRLYITIEGHGTRDARHHTPTAVEVCQKLRHAESVEHGGL